VIRLSSKDSAGIIASRAWKPVWSPVDNGDSSVGGRARTLRSVRRSGCQALSHMHTQKPP